MKNIWEEAYSNTTKIPYGIGKKICCKNCKESTQSEVTEHRQVIGNCYQWVVRCKKCNSYFVDEQN